MLKESIASRYSAALFSLTEERGCTDETIRELDAFLDVLRREPDVAAFFVSPVIDRPVKERLLRDSLASRLNELTVNFLILLVRKRRENLVELVARQMHELVDRKAGRQTARVLTPLPLPGDELRELSARLSKLYGTTIQPETKIAPDLLGGLVVQVGDHYVDDSVAGKLEEMRRHLLASTDAWPATSPNGKT